MDEEKACRDCGEVKPLERFPLQKGGRPLCKPCRAAQERARYARDRDAILARMRGDPERLRRILAHRREKVYGLTEQAYEQLCALHSGRCAICDEVRRLAVDHDHRTGVVRGLLCDRCNLGLGNLRDDPVRCVAAAHYVLRP